MIRKMRRMAVRIDRTLLDLERRRKLMDEQVEDAQVRWKLEMEDFLLDFREAQLEELRSPVNPAPT